MREIDVLAPKPLNGSLQKVGRQCSKIASMLDIAEAETQAAT